MTASSTALRTASRTAALLGAVLVSTLLGAAPAAAAPPSERPADSSSCVAQVFVPQATGDPRTVASRISEIRAVELPLYDANFGQAISGGLARQSWCRED